MMRYATYFLIGAVALCGCGARTGTFEGPSDAGGDGDEPVNLQPTVECLPDESWTTIDRRSVLYSESTDDGWISSWQWEVLESPDGSSVTPVPARADTSSITPDTEGDYFLQLTVTDNGGLTASCETLVHSIVGPPAAICPDDIMGATVGRAYTLEGDGFDDVMIRSFEWTVTARPDESVAEPIPANQPVTSFTPDVAGSFELTLTVTDNEGQEGTCTVTIVSSGPPVAICPEDATVPTRQPHDIIGEAEDDGEIAVWAWEIIEQPPRSSSVLESPGSQTTTLTPDRVGQYTLRLTVTDDTGLTDTCETVVNATPTAPDAICPDTVTTTPLTDVTLRGDFIDDGEVVGWEWTLLETPPGSAALPPSPPDLQTTTFSPDVAGEYVIGLVVFDDDGMEGSCDFIVRAIPGEGLRVELYWNPPDRSCGENPEPCDSSDVDLHLLHPDAPHWFDSSPGSSDCYYANCIGGFEWDSPGNADNPRLDLDDTEGFGPENINIDEPVVGNVYTIGVHYYGDEGSSLEASAYVSVYCGTIDVDPVYSVGPQVIEAVGWSEENDFWRVATVVWDGFTCTINPLVSEDGGPDIIVAHEAQSVR